LPFHDAEQQVTGPTPLHAAPFTRRKAVPAVAAIRLAARPQPIEQLADGREPPLAAGEPLQEAARLRMGLAARAESLPEMRRDDAHAAFGLQPILILLPQQVVELLRVFRIGGREPPAHI